MTDDPATSDPTARTGESTAGAHEPTTDAHESAAGVRESVAGVRESAARAGESPAGARESTAGAGESALRADKPTGRELAAQAGESPVRAGESTGDELAVRAAELTIRAGESALPAGESTVPADESTDGESAVRAGESTKADGESAAPAGESTARADESTMPAAESPSPAAESSLPTDKSTRSMGESTQPAGGTTPPAAESSLPAGESIRSAGESTARRAELAANLAAVRKRIAAACAAADRDPADVLLLAVTKTFPATDVALLSDLGLTYFAENRDGDAAAKVTELRNLRPDRQVRWAMVGRLQRNKARSVSEWADEVQSVDSGRLADALQHAVALSLDRGKRSEPLDVLIQASIDGDPERGGCPLSDLPALSDHIGGLDALRLRGVMAVAPLGMPPDQAFDRLAVAADHLRTDHPSATCLSSGMSGDLEQAITYGSTCVRVGTALLGGRPLASP
jgi:hypothetical protein